MAEETVRYTVDIDTAQLAQDLLNVRQQIDSTLEGVGVASAGVGTQVPMDIIQSQAALQQQMQQMQAIAASSAVPPNVVESQSILQTLIDGAEAQGRQSLEDLKFDTMTVRNLSNLPQTFAGRTVPENVLGAALGYGHDPATSPLSLREYMQRSRRNTYVSIPYIGDEAAANQDMANFLRRVSFSNVRGPLENEDAFDLARSIRNIDLRPEFSEQGFSRREVANVVGAMAQSGDFVGVDGPDGYINKIEDVLGGIRKVMHSFRATGEEAIRLQGTLRDLGVDSGETGDAALMFAARGSTVGLTARDMLAAAQTGGQLAAQFGVDPAIAVPGYQTLLQDLRYGGKTGILDKWRINALGGEMGAMQQMATSSAQFFSSGAGLMSLMGPGGASNFDDILDANIAGSVITALDPTAGVMEGLSTVAELYAASNDGRRPTPQRLAQMTAMIYPNIPVNVSMLAMQRARGFSREDYFGRYSSELTANLERQLDEKPPAGLVGAYRGVVSDVKGIARSVGEWIGWDAGLLSDVWRGYHNIDLDGAERVVLDEEIIDPRGRGAAGSNIMSYSDLMDFFDSDEVAAATMHLEAQSDIETLQQIRGTARERGLTPREKLDARNLLKKYDVNADNPASPWALDAAVINARKRRSNYEDLDPTALRIAATNKLTGKTPEDAKLYWKDEGGFEKFLEGNVPGMSESDTDAARVAFYNAFYAAGGARASELSADGGVAAIEQLVKVEDFQQQLMVTAKRYNVQNEFAEQLTQLITDDKLGEFVYGGGAQGQLILELLTTLKSEGGFPVTVRHIEKDLNTRIAEAAQ